MTDYYMLEEEKNLERRMKEYLRKKHEAEIRGNEVMASFYDGLAFATELALKGGKVDKNRVSGHIDWSNVEKKYAKKEFG